MIYLCSVYSLDAHGDSYQDASKRDERYDVVLDVTYQMLMDGYKVFSPILHCHEMSILKEMPKNFDFWRNLDFNYIDHCDKVFVLKMDGWDRSEGIAAEIAHAEFIGKSVTYIDFGYDKEGEIWYQ